MPESKSWGGARTGAGHPRKYRYIKVPRSNEPKTLLDVLSALDPQAVLQDSSEQRIEVARLLDAIEGSSELAEFAVRLDDEIYLTDENGNVYTAADPAYTIV